MKQEIHDIAWELAVRTMPSSLLAWMSSLNWSAILPVTLIVLQILYLARKWWREETEFGSKMKRWAGGVFTKPGELR